MFVPCVGCDKYTFCYWSCAVVSSAAFQRNIYVVLTLAVIKVKYFKLKCFIPL